MTFLRSQTFIHHTFDTAVRNKLGKNIELNWLPPSNLRTTFTLTKLQQFFLADKILFDFLKNINFKPHVAFYLDITLAYRLPVVLLKPCARECLNTCHIETKEDAKTVPCQLDVANKILIWHTRFKESYHYGYIFAYV